MKRTIFAFALLLALFALTAGLHSQPAPLEITYLANEGFLLRAGDQQVLIDALFGEGLPDYQAVPPPTREKLETAQPPFDQVDLVLVSHYHSDHFSSRALVRYLQSNARAILLSSPQVVDRVAARSPSLVTAAPKRFQRVEPKGYRRVPLTVAGIQLEVQYVTHGRRRASIQNLGHIIHLGGRKILHLGDADGTEEDFQQYGWAQDEIDIAFIPYWYLLSQRRRPWIKRYVQAKTIVAMHVPPEELYDVTRQLASDFPEAVIFSEPLEKMTF